MRRAHKKSRHGCQECKIRRMKCDETRPACTNCTATNRDCSLKSLYGPSLPRPQFAPGTVSASVGEFEGLARDNDTWERPGPGASSEDASSTPRSDSQGTTQVAGSEADFLSSTSWTSPPYSLHHFELLDHFSTVLSKSLVTDHASTTSFAELAVRQAYKCSFLMDVLLAIAAVHKSTLILKDNQDASHSERKFLRNESIMLQERAIGAFRHAYASPSATQNNVTNDINSFLFSSLIGQHTLFDAFSTPRDSFDSVIDRLVSCMRLHRGIPTMAQPSQSSIEAMFKHMFSGLETNSEAQASAPDPEVLKASQRAQRGKAACEELLTYFQSVADLNVPEESATSLQQNKMEQKRAEVRGILASTEMLMNMFEQYGNCPDPSTIKLYLTKAVHQWLVKVPDEFVRLLELHNLHALLVLSYYAVLLHYAQFYWAVNDGGAYLISKIQETFGPHQGQWLKYPAAELIIDEQP